MWRAAVITVSDSRTGTADDVSGSAVAERLQALPATVVERRLVPDDVAAITGAVCDVLQACDLLLLTGGTGLAVRDVTPQAVRPLLEYEVPGMAEAMRWAGLKHTPHAMLSRQVAGVVQRRLVLVLPGSPRGALESLDAVWAALPHALALLRGDETQRSH